MIPALDVEARGVQEDLATIGKGELAIAQVLTLLGLLCLVILGGRTQRLEDGLDKVLVGEGLESALPNREVGLGTDKAVHDARHGLGVLGPGRNGLENMVVCDMLCGGAVELQQVVVAGARDRPGLGV
ncbi:hypothetical protein ATCV1_z684R [Acanthocystis turfacea chlorella virus 1]|uniref:Uncharacterized protein z684R n=1 Tax=Chlorovirus heliozoae TaxID=322019 RepID=A7K9U4_9PHYC|nr:hypothetical protein ATCV1_z684R [Acanthocystis turfacea chlorella virus 1]ABT16818.1 hypothetical protein ATCV1_z684R [Acanthocystis turfacea chlorella virus 1]